MPQSTSFLDRLLGPLRELGWADSIGSAAAALGVLLTALGWILVARNVGPGVEIRTLGGIVLLAGLAAMVLGSPERRAAVTGKSRRIARWYVARTSNWRRPYRVGVASIAISLALIVPMLAMQVLFENGALIAVPAILLFWGGVAIIVVARFPGFIRFRVDGTRKNYGRGAGRRESGRTASPGAKGRG